MNYQCVKLCGKPVEYSKLTFAAIAKTECAKKEEPRKKTLLVAIPNKRGGGFLGWVGDPKTHPFCFVLFCIRLRPLFASGLAVGLRVGFSSVAIMGAIRLFISGFAVLLRSAAFAPVCALLPEIH